MKPGWLQKTHLLLCVLDREGVCCVKLHQAGFKSETSGVQSHKYRLALKLKSDGERNAVDFPAHGYPI